jgi:hypothetical protein
MIMSARPVTVAHTRSVYILWTTVLVGAAAMIGVGALVGTLWSRKR